MLQLLHDNICGWWGRSTNFVVPNRRAPFDNQEPDAECREHLNAEALKVRNKERETRQIKPSWPQSSHPLLQSLIDFMIRGLLSARQLEGPIKALVKFLETLTRQVGSPCFHAWGVKHTAATWLAYSVGRLPAGHIPISSDSWGIGARYYRHTVSARLHHSLNCACFLSRIRKIVRTTLWWVWSRITDPHEIYSTNTMLLVHRLDYICGLFNPHLSQTFPSCSTPIGVNDAQADYSELMIIKMYEYC